MSDDPGYNERWKKSYSLGETVYRMVERKQTDTPEFKTLLNFFGRDKLKQVYAMECERREKRRQPDVAARRLGERDDSE